MKFGKMLNKKICRSIRLSHIGIDSKVIVDDNDLTAYTSHMWISSQVDNCKWIPLDTKIFNKKPLSILNSLNYKKMMSREF